MIASGSLASRLAALCLPAILVAVPVALGGEAAWGWYREREARLALLTRQGDGYARLLARRAEFDAALSALDEEAGAEPWLWPQTNALRAGLAIQEALSALVEEAGGEVRVIDPQESRPMPDAEQLTAVGIGLQAVIDLEGLQLLLFRLETRRPRLIVRALDVRGAAGPWPDMLQVQARIVGYWTEQPLTDG